MSTEREARPFDIQAYLLGAKYGCRSHHFTPQVLLCEGDHLYGVIRRENANPTVHQWDKATGAEYPGGTNGPHDLVMLPLFEIDGKSVFVGDEIMNDGGHIVKASAALNNDAGMWRWPKKAPVVETRMTDAELHAIAPPVMCDASINPHDASQVPSRAYTAMRQRANAAIARAIADGDIIPAETAEKMIHAAASEAASMMGYMISTNELALAVSRAKDAAK